MDLPLPPKKKKKSRKPAYLGGLEDPWILFCDIVVIKRIHGSSKNTENSNNWNSNVNFEGSEDPWILLCCHHVRKRIHGSSSTHRNTARTQKNWNYHGLSRPENGFLNRTKEIVRLVDNYTRMDSCWFIAIHLRLIFPELPVRKAQLRQYPRIPIFFGNFPDLLKGSLSSHPLRND